MPPGEDCEERPEPPSACTVQAVEHATKCAASSIALELLEDGRVRAVYQFADALLPAPAPLPTLLRRLDALAVDHAQHAALCARGDEGAVFDWAG